MLCKALLSAAIMLCIPLITVLTEILVRKIFHTHCTENIYCVFPISENTEDVEIKLMSLSKSLESACIGNFTVFIADFGASENTVNICKKYCADVPCFVMIEPQSLSALITYGI